jgi:hypothetical protein
MQTDSRCQAAMASRNCVASFLTQLYWTNYFWLTPDFSQEEWELDVKFLLLNT